MAILVSVSANATALHVEYVSQSIKGSTKPLSYQRVNLAFIPFGNGPNEIPQFPSPFGLSHHRGMKVFETSNVHVRVGNDGTIAVVAEGAESNQSRIIVLDSSGHVLWHRNHEEHGIRSVDMDDQGSILLYAGMYCPWRKGKDGVYRNDGRIVRLKCNYIAAYNAAGGRRVVECPAITDHDWGNEFIYQDGSIFMARQKKTDGVSHWEYERKLDWSAGPARAGVKIDRLACFMMEAREVGYAKVAFWDASAGRNGQTLKTGSQSVFRDIVDGRAVIQGSGFLGGTDQSGYFIFVRMADAAGRDESTTRLRVLHLNARGSCDGYLDINDPMDVPPKLLVYSFPCAWGLNALEIDAHGNIYQFSFREGLLSHGLQIWKWTPP